MYLSQTKIEEICNVLFSRTRKSRGCTNVTIHCWSSVVYAKYAFGCFATVGLSSWRPGP